MKLKDLLNTLRVGVNYYSVDLIENLEDCKRIDYLYECHVFDIDKFESWCKNNRIIYSQTEYNNELVYKLEKIKLLKHETKRKC